MIFALLVYMFPIIDKENGPALIMHSTIIGINWCQITIKPLVKGTPNPKT